MAAFLGGIASAIGGIVSSSQQRNAANAQIQGRIDGVNAAEDARQDLIGSVLGGRYLGEFGLEDVFGRKPEGIPYEPVDITQSLRDSIDDNLEYGLPAALQLSTAVNNRFADDVLRLNLDRVRTLYPGYDDSVATYTGATQDLLEGRLPFDDVMDIVSDRNSLAASLGTPGNQGAPVLKDLGISRLNAIQQGGNMFQSFLGTLSNNVSPIPQFNRPDQNFPFTMLAPQSRLEADITQAQLLQQSLQSAEFLDAGPVPGAQALFGADYQALPYVAGVNGGLTQAPGGLGLGQAVSGIGNALGGLFGGGGGGGLFGGGGGGGNYFQPTAVNQFGNPPAFNSAGLPVAQPIGGGGGGLFGGLFG